MNMRGVCFAVFLFVLSAVPTEAQIILTLDAASELLEQQNITLKQQSIAVLLAEEDHRIAKNQRLPTLSFGAGHNYNYGLAFDQVAGQLITGNKWSNMANARINAQTVVFQGFSLRNRIKDVILQIESTQTETERLERSLKLDLLSHYFDVVANQALYESSVEKLNYAKEQLRQKQEQFELGTKTLVDVSLAENQVATDELQVLVSSNAYETKMLELKQLLNIDYRDSVVLVVPDIASTVVDWEDTALENIVSHDPVVKLAQLQLDRTELSLHTLKGTYYPTVSLSGGYGTNYSSERMDYLTGVYMPFWNQVNQNRSLNFGLSISIPIFDGWQTRGEIKKAKLQIQHQRYEAEKILMEQEGRLRSIRQEYLRTVKEYQASQTQYESLKNSYEAIKARYEMGVASSMDYAKSLLDFNMAEFNMIRTRYMFLYHAEVLRIYLGHYVHDNKQKILQNRIIAQLLCS